MRKVAICVIFMSSFLMGGCSKINSAYENVILEKSGVKQEAEYLEADKLSKDGNVSSEGYYEEESLPEDTVHDGKIHVTFGENSNLDVNYYRDEQHEKPLDISDLYMNPGDSIYADVKVKEDIPTNMYTFSNMDFYTYENESRKNASGIEENVNGGSVSITIGQDYKGTELSVLPVGRYETRTISLENVAIDDQGKETPIAGEWSVNEKKIDASDFTVDAVAPFIVSYKFDSDEYYFDSSVPDAYYVDNDEGRLIFKEQEPLEDISKYSVMLQKYSTIEIPSNVERIVILDDGVEKKVKKDESFSLPRVSINKKYSIKTNSTWSELERYKNEANGELEVIGPENKEGKYLYTVVVADKDAVFTFNPSDYHYSHGKIDFYFNKNRITSSIKLRKGRKIEYRKASVDPGYYLPMRADGNNYIIVSTADATKKNLESISFKKEKTVKVTLNQPEKGGEIRYSIGGKEISSNPFETKSGTEIHMEFKPWDGWTSAFKNDNKQIYEVTEEETQDITDYGNNGIELNEIFKESEDHKPILTVLLSKTVGKNMQLKLRGDNLAVDAAQYGNGWNITNLIDSSKENYDILSGDQYIVKDLKIGTGDPVEATLSNTALQSGKAVKISIEKVSNSKGKKYEQYYVKDLTEPIQPFNIYTKEEQERKVTAQWYKSIKISIGMVDIKDFQMPVASENTRLTVTNLDDNGTELKEGDTVEASTKVTVLLEPSEGYYLTGSDLKNGVYRATMKYSDFAKKIPKIIEKHPAKKLCHIKLDASDSFATYTYKLGKNIVTGEVDATEGETLILEYKINDDAYKLKEKAGGFFGVGRSDKEVTSKIKLTSENDGKTISKESFGIEVVKG